jgi:hypothetical protein
MLTPGICLVSISFSTSESKYATSPAESICIPVSFGGFRETGSPAETGPDNPQIIRKTKIISIFKFAVMINVLFIRT